MQLLILCPLIFLASFIDAIAGGGGLISLTSYNAVGIVGVQSLGTNKFSSFFGNTLSCINYIRTKNFHLVSMIPALIGAIVGSTIGSKIALLVSGEKFSLIMLIATPIVFAFTVMKKNFQPYNGKQFSNTKYIVISLIIGLVVGCYDGFFGPGTGMFLQLAFIAILKLEPKKAAGTARIVNWGSSLAANITFITSGNVLFTVGIPCAICSIVGGLLGSQLAIKKDVKIIRPVMIVVVILLFIKLSLDYLGIL